MKLKGILIILIIFYLSIFQAYSLVCTQTDNGIYTVMFPDSINRIFHDIYRGSEVSYSEFIDYGNKDAPSYLETGDSLCLPVKRKLIYNPSTGETFWNIWNRHISYYGITFSQFVISNYEKSTGIEDASLDAFQQNLKTKADIKALFPSLEIIYNEELLELNNKANEIALTKIKGLDKEKIVQHLEADIDYSDIESLIVHPDKSYNIRYVIYPKEVFDSANLNAGAISAEIFSAVYGEPSLNDISVVIIESVVSAITYPEDTILDSFEENLFDRIIKESTSLISSSKSITEVIEFIDKEIYNAALLVYDGIDARSNLEMNGNPSPFNLPVSDQDLLRLNPVQMTDQIIYINYECDDDSKKSALSLSKELNKFSIKNELLDEEKCLNQKEVIKSLSSKDRQGYFIHIISSDSEKAIYNSFKGGMLSFFISEDLERMQNYLSHISQASIILYISKGTDLTNIISGIKSFNAWDNLDIDKRMTDIAIIKGKSIYDAIDQSSSNEVVRDVMKKIAYHESRGLPVSESAAGCKGLFHLCQYTASHNPETPICDKAKGCTGYDFRLNPEKNLEAAASYFTMLYDSFKMHSNVKELMVLSYYGGFSLISKAVERSKEKGHETIFDSITADLIKEVYCYNMDCVDLYYKTDVQLNSFSEKIIHDTRVALQ